MTQRDNPTDKLENVGQMLLSDGHALLLNEVRSSTGNIKADAGTDAMKNLDKIVSAVQFLPNGNYPVGEVNGLLKSVTGRSLNGLPFMDGVTEIKKHGEHIEIDRAKPLDLPIHAGGGPVSINKLEVGNVSLDLKHQDGKTVLDNINGISVKGDGLGMPLSGGVKQLTLSRDSQGQLNIDSKVDNPLPGPARFELDAPSQLEPKFVVDQSGKAKLVNGDQLMGNTKRAAAVDAGAIALTGPLGFVTGPIMNNVLDAL